MEQRPPRTAALDCRAVATRLERISEEYFESHDKTLVEEAIRLLRSTADRLQGRTESVR
jgi:hypothetical protein